MKKYQEFKGIKAIYKKELLNSQKQFKKDLKSNSIEKIKIFLCVNLLTFQKIRINIQ